MEEKSYDELDLWMRHEKTDPAYTKHVSQRGGYTSIDATYQLKRMTQEFGPVGKGWKYDVQYSNIETKDHDGKCIIMVCADVTLSWRDDIGPDDSVFSYKYGPVRGANMLVEIDKSGKTRIDEDAPKKAMTDALTKAISHLGFSADVYLGKYDDNKYVKEIREEFRNQAERNVNDDYIANSIIQKFETATTLEELKMFRASRLSEINSINTGCYERVKEAYTRKSATLK